MPAVAEVQFKASGSQQVEQAFKSVGTAAQDGSTKIQQNSNALKSMGTGMKSSVSSIGQVTTAFATLSLSIVNTYRSYRDLGDAQLAVDRANLKVSKTQNAIRLLEKDIAKDRKEGAKGSLDYAIASNKIVQAEAKLAKDRKDGKHTAAELKGEELAIAKMRKDGVGNTQQLTDKETKLNLLREQLGIATTNAGEAQERFNDIQQNFYLSIIPTALSSLGLLTTAFKGLGGALRGGGGLIGGLGPIGLILGGITLAIVAFKTNFLGLRDVVGGVIQWLKDRFGVWKQTIEDVFNLVRKGDWGDAFNKIKEAAIAFWADLKKSVPFFGEVETLVNKIRGGNWKGAFLQIWKAASDVWTTIKNTFPLFGDIEKLVLAISQGKWSDAFDAIKKAVTDSGLVTAIESLFGEGWITNITTRIQSIPEILKSSGNLALQEAKAGNWAGVGKAISDGIMGALTASGGQAVIDTMLKTGIGPAAILAAWKDPKQRLYWYGIGKATVDGIGEALGAVASFLDPYIAKLITTIFDPTTWTTLLSAASTTATDIGTAIITTLGSGISTASADPKALLTYFTDIGTNIWNGITDWMTENAPETTAAITNLVNSFTTSMNNAAIDFQNMGRETWNSFVKGWKDGMVTWTKTPLFDFTPFSKQIKDAVNSPEFKKAGEIPLIPKVDMKPAQQTVKKGTDTISKLKPVIKIDANMAAANAKWNAFANKVRMTTLQVKIAGTSVNMRTGSQAGAYGGPKQHGYQSTVKRPTLFMAGEGGRPEDVVVRPRGSVQRGGSVGGGGFYGTVNVYVDGVLRPARYDMGARK